MARFELLILLALQVLAPARSQTTMVTLPEWLIGAQCSVVGTEGVVTGAVARTAVFDCIGVGDTVSCDAENSEPLDLRLSRVCSTATLPFIRASLARVISTRSVIATVEWLDLPGNGQPVVLAARTVALDRVTTVRVAQTPTRFIRFGPTGFSPVTVSTADMFSSPDWRLPLIEGGEFFVSARGVGLRPESFTLSGPQRAELRSTSGDVFSVVGLQPGQYLATPQYIGGAKGEPIVVRIEAGKSTLHPFKGEALGVLTTTASPEACGSTNLIRVGGPSGLFVAPHLGQCGQTFAGLKPGRYNVSLWDQNGPMFHREIDVAAHAQVSVHFAGQLATVGGRVLLNGKPEPGFIIEFRRASGRVLPAVAPVEHGSYSVTVGEPGEYLVRVKDKRRFSLRVTDERKVTLAEGSNSFDWEAVGGILAVRLVNWERQEPASIRILGTDGKFGGESLRLAINEDSETRIVGLPFGRYRVTAEEPVRNRRKIAAPVIIELSPAKPDASVTMNLAEHALALILRDETGLPISSADIPGEPVGEGLYSLTVQQGTELRLWPRGFAPVCRVVPNGGVLELVLRRSRPLEIQIIGGRRPQDPLAAVVPEGSDCRLPLQLLRYTSAPSQQVGTRAFHFADMPTAGKMIVYWTDTGQSTLVEIPSVGPLILRAPIVR